MSLLHWWFQRNRAAFINRYNFCNRSNHRNYFPYIYQEKTVFWYRWHHAWLCDPDDRNADHERCCLSSERESAFRQTSDHVHESIYGNPCRDRIYSSFAECFCFCRYPPGTVHYRIDHLCSCTSDHNGYRRWRRMSGSSFLNRNEQERKAYCSDLSAERFIWYDFLVHRILFCKCHRAFPIYGWNYVTFPCGTFEYGIPASDDPCSCSIYRQDWKACLLPY